MTGDVAGIDTRLVRRATLRWLGWFAFANGMVLALLALRYLAYMPWPQASSARLFTALSMFGHFMFLALLPVLPLGLLALLLPRRVLLPALAIVVYSALVLLIVVDVRVFELYRFHLNSMVWNLLTGGAVREILVFDAINFALGGLVVLSAVVLELGLAGVLWRVLRRRRNLYGAWLAGATAALMLAGQGLYAWADATGNTALTRQIELLPWPQPLTMKHQLRSLGVVDAEPATAPALADSDPARLAYPLRPLECQAPDDPLNVLMIVIDGLRFDMLNPEVTPNLSRLASRGWRFSNHLSSGNATRFGIFGLFYGLHGMYWDAMLHARRGAVLIQQMQAQGYRFGLHASAALSSPEFDRTVFADVRGQLPPRTAGATVIEREWAITRAMSEFLRSRDPRPFFGFIFYDAPHAFVYPEEEAVPFQPAWSHVNYLNLDKASDPEGFFNRYRNAVHFDDRLIAQVLAALADGGHARDTVVIVTGDHGTEFNESGGGYWGHNGNFSRYQTQVPMLIVWPGQVPAEFTHPTSHADLAPTLLRDLLGCSNPVRDYSHGRHLLETAPREYRVIASWGRYAIRESGRISVFKHFGLHTVYDLDYQALPEAQLNTAVAVQVVRDMARFFRREAES